MKTSELKNGKQYYYTAGAEWVQVVYKHRTINGYLFSNGDAESVLTSESVNKYILE